MEKHLLEKEFTALVEEHQRIIYKVCYIYAENKEHLSDLYQETVFNLWKSFPNFRYESKVSTWVYRIALNTCLSLFRRFSRKPKILPLTSILDIMEEDNATTELLQELYFRINRLNDLEKALILLYLEEKSYQEIANITGLTITNVATKLNRTKDKLKKMSNL
ncbi:sigma-70 family RNA polymerase sigma factor [uncultured Sanguibacteroides sp.]|uniref:RNA polymerase sigma factor n=1 Tax=uncultured Sanguibacteroides sp. TaxID=1635151 RepID=UPI0025DB2639|nr:sigma-70 family RNA polymerase sigma factor [uncultured Sanguibacteroides sp.]